MKRIYLLGSRGMLGQMVLRHFGARAGIEVVPVELRFDYENLINHFRRYDSEPPATFVNCIGGIPQKLSRLEEFVLPNVLLPLELARSLAPHHRLIHPSTDCVFRGDRGSPYPGGTPTDSSDPYGWSKLQAERALITRPNTVIIRTSIIGPSSGPAVGLLQWFLSQPINARLSGFKNHHWNGITTQQWCVEVERIISTVDVSEGFLVQLAWSGGCSKYDLLKMFRDVFRPDISVKPVEHKNSIDRRLVPDIEAPNLREQLELLQNMVKTS